MCGGGCVRALVQVDENFGVTLIFPRSTGGIVQVHRVSLDKQEECWCSPCAALSDETGQSVFLPQVHASGHSLRLLRVPLASFMGAAEGAGYAASSVSVPEGALHSDGEEHWPGVPSAELKISALDVVLEILTDRWLSTFAWDVSTGRHRQEALFAAPRDSPNEHEQVARLDVRAKTVCTIGEAGLAHNVAGLHSFIKSPYLCVLRDQSLVVLDLRSERSMTVAAFEGMTAFGLAVDETNHFAVTDMTTFGYPEAGKALLVRVPLPPGIFPVPACDPGCHCARPPEAQPPAAPGGAGAASNTAKCARPT